MPDITTPNLGLTKPEPGASENTWGDKLNANMDLIDGLASGYLRSVSALSLAANEIPYATGATTAAKTPLTSFARTLLDDANAATARATLGLGAVATDSVVPVARGGTGGTTAAAARSNLGVYSTAQVYSTAEADARYPQLTGSGVNEFGANMNLRTGAYNTGSNNGYGFSLQGVPGGGGQLTIQNQAGQSGGGASIFVYHGNSFTFRVNNNGDVRNQNNVYGAISDARLKENITDATAQLDELQGLRVVNYSLIGDPQKHIGLIAQEVQGIKPGLVEADEDTGMLTVKYSVLVPILVKAVQELTAQVRELRDAGN